MQGDSQERRVIMRVTYTLKGWSGFSPVDADQPLSTGPDDLSDELPKGTQHFYKDNMICKHILINLHKPSVGAGK